MSFSRFFPCFQFRLEDDIYKLDYSNNVLSEGFPHVWQHERTLEELNVSSTRINYLPPQLFYCQGLKVLLASSNNLENIPEAIGTWRQLQQLNLSRNFISYVPDNIKSCKNLTYLDLSCNSLRKLPEALTCLISLQELILNETYLEFLPANFGRLVNLKIVELRSNNLVSLPKSMQRLINLQRLDIGCNEFIKMPEVIGELKQLRELWFDSNQIQTLPSQTGILRQLMHFEANGNCLTNIPSDIGNWNHLEVFSVSINNLSALPSSIGMLKSLVTLKCESNELTELPISISTLENLEELVLSDNSLACLPNTIGMLRKLRYLFADNNMLQKLPDEICSCSALSIVSVSRNKLSALPDNLGHLTNLKVLNIVQNNIETLPVSVLSLVKLKSLWIRNNQSQPLIPLQYTEVFQKTQLTCFMLPQLSNKQNGHIDNKLATEPKYATDIDKITKKTSLCSISKRRICFAEETTILHNDKQISHLSIPACSTNENNSVTLNLNYSQPQNFIDICGTTKVVDEQLNRKNYLMRSPTPYPKELRLLSKYLQNQKNISINDGNSIQHVPISSPTLYNHELQKSDQNIIEENGNLHGMQIVDAKSDCFSEEYQDTIPRNGSMYNELSVDSNQQFLIANNSPKPPPYHIARCFTKKSVDDLSKYETARKQQGQNNYSSNNESFEQSLLLRNLDNEVIPNNNFYFDSQSNMVKQCEPYDQPENFNDFESHVMGPWEVVDDPENPTNLAKTKVNKTKSKWLFGAHKNPRVLQVNLNLENGPDFQIDTLPNRDGIYVVSTTSMSKASQILHPLDKLLEVEGIDFTNISIQEARHVLHNSRPSIAIMLSRK